MKSEFSSVARLLGLGARVVSGIRPPNVSHRLDRECRHCRDLGGPLPRPEAEAT